MSQPNSQRELQALMEEKERLLRRLNDKQRGVRVPVGGSATKKPISHDSSARDQREQGFNVYISGANEERVKQQRDRETRKEAGPRTKTWSKPTVSAPSSNPSTSRSLMDEGGEVVEDLLLKQQPPTQAANQQKQPRKQWNVAPVALKGADALIAPPTHSAASSSRLADRSADEVEEDLPEVPHEEAEEPRFFSHQREHQHEDDIVEQSLDVETAVDEPSYDEEGFDPLSPPKSVQPSTAATRVRQNQAQSDVALRESIQEDIASLRERLARAEEEDTEKDREQDIPEEDESLPPTSPEPIALRKKDVSLLRESLEILTKQPAPQQESSAGARAAPIPPFQPFTVESDASLYNNDPSPFPSKRSDVVSAGTGRSAASAATLPAPATSTSPTLPTRSLQSGGRSARGNKPAPLASVAAAPPQPVAPVAVGKEIVLEEHHDIGPYKNVRTSLSFADGDDEDEKEQSRPSTPTNTDDSALRSSLILSQSFDKSTIESFLARFKTLSKKKRMQWLKTLIDIEREEEGGIPPDIIESLGMFQAETKKQQETSTTVAAAPTAHIASAPDIKDDSEKLVVLVPAPVASSGPVPSLAFRVLSNWGHPTSCGLTLIEVFDMSGQKIRVPPSAVYFNWTSNHPSAPRFTPGETAKIFSGKTGLTTEEKAMWSAQVGNREDIFIAGTDSTAHGFEIQVFLPSFFPPSATVKIWNWNRFTDLNRGVRKMEIRVNGERKWEGEVSKGSGLSDSDYSTKVILCDIAASPIAPIAAVPAAVALAASQPVDEGAKTLPASAVTAQPAALAAAAAPSALSDRPSWLVGTTAATGTVKEESPSQPAPTLEHSASAAALSVGRRRPSATNQRENLSTAAGDSSSAAQSGMVPPLLPASSWSDAPLAPEVKRPMSGRRAVGAVPPKAPSAAAGQPSILPTAESSSKRVPSAGRRRPSVDHNILPAPMSSSTNPSPSASPSQSPMPSDDYPPSYPTAARDSPMPHEPSTVNKRRSELEESWDSLEHFRHHHHGRLPPPVAEAALAGAQKTLGASKSAAVIGTSTIVPLPGASTTAAAGVGDKLAPSAPRSTSADDLSVPILKSREPLEEEFELDLPTAPSPAPIRPSSFVMSTLPTGRRLTFSLLSTYGDAYYIGLSGLELFDGEGKLIQFPDRKRAISASPADVNVLPGVKNDPRVVSNLLDGVNATCDDFHLWLAPYSRGKRHIILIDLPGDKPMTLSFLRIWNYNKSRIHAARGVKELEISFDGNVIFRGEIAQAPGNVAEAPTYSENILFTTDPRILAKVAMHTQAESSEDDSLVPPPSQFDRPPTGGSDGRPVMKGEISVHTSVDFTVARPKTSAATVGAQLVEKAAALPKAFESTVVSKPSSDSKSSVPSFSVRGTEICFYLVSTWGDAYFVGLTGLELYDQHGNAIPFSASNLTAYPRDINTVPGHSGDNRTLDKLVNGINVTLNDNNMWLAPKLQPEDGVTASSGPKSKWGEQWLKVTLSSPASISSFRIWNYNKNEEDTYRGMKFVRVTIDGNLVSPTCGFLFRKAPGLAEFDFGQTIYLREQPNQLEVISKEMRKKGDLLVPVLPCGFMLKFLFLSTWNDSHYIGLNGLELYDHNGLKIPISMRHVFALPSSLNDLNPEGGVDTRTVDKLFDGINDTFDDRHMWLAPLLPPSAPGAHPKNVLYIYFDAAISLSAIKFWNYSKTSTRGVQAFQVLLDDVIIHDGILRPAPTKPTKDSFAQTILFTTQSSVVDRESIHSRVDLGEQDVLLVDERKFMNQPSAQAAPIIPSGKTHAQVAATAKLTGLPRPITGAKTGQ